jgi:hypothetical protein
MTLRLAPFLLLHSFRFWQSALKTRLGRKSILTTTITVLELVSADSRSLSEIKAYLEFIERLCTEKERARRKRQKQASLRRTLKDNAHFDSLRAHVRIGMHAFDTGLEAIAKNLLARASSHAFCSASNRCVHRNS